MGIVQGRGELRAKVLLAVGSTSGTTPEKVRHETGVIWDSRGRGPVSTRGLDRPSIARPFRKVPEHTAGIDHVGDPQAPRL
jgi:hypothetical protein